MSHPKVILGTGSAFGSSKVPGIKFNNAQKAQEAIDLFKRYGHNEIDTARRYPDLAPGSSEAVIGLTNIKDWGLVDTKVHSNAGQHAPEELAKSVNESLEALQMNKVHMMYLHFPDRETSLDDMLRGMDILHKQGKFEKLGISNYSAEEIKQMMAICDREGYVRPSVYQGQYNAVARRAEEALLPTLRAYNISYYAYSPAAGGIFNKTSSRMNSKKKVGDFYRATFGGTAMTAAIDKARQAAEASGIDGHALALRWTLHHSILSAEHGDAMIIGASSMEQLEQTLQICATEPLPEHLVNLMQEVWEEAKPTAPSYSFWVKMEGAPDSGQAVSVFTDKKGSK